MSRDRESTKSAPPEVDPAVWRAAAAVLVGGLAVLFDTTIVAIALHTLSVELHASVATIQWVSTAYLLAMGVAIPLVGWAQRSIGGRRLWIAALAVFLAGSILSSLAWSAGSLIAFRVVQGVGGGMMMPLMSTLVMQAAGGCGLGRIMSVVSLPAVLGPVLGPVLGGLILEHWHWSWMFWVNVPFCVAGLVLAVLVLPADGPVRPAPLDIVGLALLAPGLVGVLYGLSHASQPGNFGRDDVLIPLVAGLALLIAFGGWSGRRRSRALVDLSLLRHWPLASSALLLFLSAIALYGAMLLMPLYFQQVRGLSVLTTGLLLIPQGVGSLASRSMAGRLSDTMGSRWLVVIGFLLAGVATIPFAFADASTGELGLMCWLLVRGAGLGIVTVPLMALGFRGMPRADIPDASIITRVAQQLGGSFGTAALAVVLIAAQTAVDEVTRVHAFQIAFWWAIGFTAVGMLTALVLPGREPAADMASGRAPQQGSVQPTR